ncbi:pilus assembly protein PilM [bacterium]|nr:pilus assembly protein PilM [bacterium]
MRSIGLDIGEYSVKLVELVQSKKNISINQIQEKQLSQNVSVEDKELEVIEFVRSFLASGDYSQARWILAVKQDQVTTRYKTFPFSDRIKIQKSLSFEMEEDIPFDTDACVFDAKVVQTQGTSSDILATAIPKNHVEKIIDMASNFGVEIYAITVDGLAFSNLVEDWEQPAPAITQAISLTETDKPKKHIQIVLNIGHKKTLFTAYDNNRLIFTRSLFWGANQLITEIIKKQEISYIEAVRLLQTHSHILLNKENASFEQAQFSNLLTKNLKELVRDIQMTLLELESEHNADITAIHFTGGASLITNLGGFLTQHLEVPCNPIHLLQSYAGSLAAMSSPQQAHEVESKFTTAVAIALEAFKKPRNPATNLLKGEFAKQNDAFKVFWKQWGTVAQVGIAAMLVLFVWTSFRGTFATTLNEKGDEAIIAQAKSVARLPKKQANENGVKKYIKENKKKANELKLVAQVAQMNSALDLLKKVSESAPSKDQAKIDIMNFTVKDDIVQIVGYASSPKDVASLSQNLKNLSTDGQVNTQPSNLSLVPNRVAFNLSFRADRGLVK